MPSIVTDGQLAQLQLAAYEYPDAFGHSALFAWDWQCTLQAAAAPIAAGLKRVGDAQVIIMPGTGGGLDAAETRRQWMLNLSPFPDKMAHPLFGWVCRRFYDEIDDFLAQLLPHLDPAGDVYATGHSRGAPQAAYVAGLLFSRGFKVKRLIQFAPPRGGGGEFAAYMLPISKILLRNEPPNWLPDPVTTVPYDIPVVEECTQLGALTKITTIPVEHGDDWGVVAAHHMQYYEAGTP